MPLTPEDGTGIDGADSYLSLDDADAYWADHGNPEGWTGAAASDKESALRYASRWLDGKFQWTGRLSKSTQGLGWPRVLGIEYVSSFDDEGRYITGVPEPVKAATAELALIHIATFPLNRVVKPDASLRSVSAGSVSVTYNDSRTSAEMDYLNSLLRGLYDGGGIGGGMRSIRLERG